MCRLLRTWCALMGIPVRSAGHCAVAKYSPREESCTRYEERNYAPWFDKIRFFPAEKEIGRPTDVGAEMLEPRMLLSAAGIAYRPTIALPAMASLNQVTDTTASLAVAANDIAGQNALSYTWSTSKRPVGAPAPVFNTNGNSAAENVTVTLRQAGAYKFTVKVTGPGKLTASSSVGVTVSPVLAKLSITPNQATVAPGGSQQFAAEGFDQFGRAIALPPGLTWAATAGTIASGRLVAPTVLENVSVTATDGSVQATATVAVGSNFLGISDPSLGYVTANLFARDGSINREDMIQILQSIGAEGSVVTAAELSGLTTILNDACAVGNPRLRASAAWRRAR